MPIFQIAKENWAIVGCLSNDTGFWMFNEYFGLSIKETVKTWPQMQFIISLLGLAGGLLTSSLKY